MSNENSVQQGRARNGDTDRILIIGGGIAGLACGCYLQMNGYKTEILEASDVPGGLCVAWRRGPYLFDGCLRWLVGADPSSYFQQIWKQLGAVTEGQIVPQNEFLRVEGAAGESLAFTADLDQLARDMKRIGPQDAALIDELISAARKCAPLDPLPQLLDLMSIPAKTMLLIKYLPMLLVIGWWKNRELGPYLAKWKTPFLREALLALAGDNRMSALVIVMVLGWRSRKNVGYVVGGSRAFSQAVASRYASLGGVLRLKTPVERIVVKNGVATGVTCADGVFAEGSTVVSCADGYSTVHKMLEGCPVPPKAKALYEQYEPFPGLVQVSLGVNRVWPDAPPTVCFKLCEPLKVDDKTVHDRLDVALSTGESGLCPQGKTIMLVRFFSRYEYWADLKQRDPAAYDAAKEALLEKVISLVEQRFPGVRASLERRDIATPWTFGRYTGNWQGSFQGWLPTPCILGRRLPRQIAGIKNVYLAGHWVEPGGGIPSVALSGLYVAQLICARDGKRFSCESVNR